jgi:hypothetical protein
MLKCKVPVPCHSRLLNYAATERRERLVIATYTPVPPLSPVGRGCHPQPELDSLGSCSPSKPLGFPLYTPGRVWHDTPVVAVYR